jgi:hypothetical protein
LKNTKQRIKPINAKKLTYGRDWESFHLGKKKQMAGIINKFNGIVMNKTKSPKPKGPPLALIILIDIGKK